MAAALAASVSSTARYVGDSILGLIGTSMPLVNTEILILPICERCYSVSRIANDFWQHTCIICYRYLFFADLESIQGVDIVMTHTVWVIVFFCCQLTKHLSSCDRHILELHSGSVCYKEKEENSR